MPVTFRLAKKRVKPVRRFVPATDGEDLLRNSTWRYSTARHCGVVLQSSFGSNFKGFHKDGLDLGKHAVYPVSHGNGFVDTAIIAYNEHHHLVIRPDDVWMSILSQFCLYVNANAEALRHLFVQDEGKKVLTIDMRGAGAAKKVDEKSPSLQIDFGVVAKGLTDLFQNYISDTDFRDWFLPSFSTTTETDRVVASSIMMATFKEYLAPEACILCGIPAVTLLGDRDDWEKIRTKARDLLKYDKGGQMANWYRLLNPVLERFVRTFDTEEEGHYSRKDRDYFWQRIANVHVGGSGPTWLSGWITAFCFFDSEGKMMYSEPNAGHNEVLVLDGFRYHWVKLSKIPPAFCEVEALLKIDEKDVKALVVSGLVAFQAYFGQHLRAGVIDKDGNSVSESEVDSGSEDGPPSNGLDSVQPVSGWWLVEKVAREERN